MLCEVLNTISSFSSFSSFLFFSHFFSNLQFIYIYIYIYFFLTIFIFVNDYVLSDSASISISVSVYVLSVLFWSSLFIIIIYFTLCMYALVTRWEINLFFVTYYIYIILPYTTYCICGITIQLILLILIPFTSNMMYRVQYLYHTLCVTSAKKRKNRLRMEEP